MKKHPQTSVGTSPIHSGTIISIPTSNCSISPAETKGGGQIYVRLSWICYAIAILITFSSYGPLVTIGSLSVALEWSNYKEVIQYCDLTAMLIGLTVFAAVAGCTLRYRDREIIKARGHTFLCVILVSGTLATVTIYLLSMQYHGIWNWPEGLTYATMVVAKLSRSCFVSAILSRQRLIYLAFSAFKVREKSKYEFERGVLVGMLLALLSLIPFSLVFFSPESYPFFVLYVGELIWATIVLVAFGYYTFKGRSAGPRFADFYQNVRMFIVYPILFYVGVYIEIEYKYSPLAAFFFYYAGTIPVVVYMLDTFGFIGYVIYKGVDCQVPVIRGGASAALSKRSSKITNFTIPIPKIPTIETIIEDTEVTPDNLQMV